MNNDLIPELASKGYWPAVAAEYFNDKKYSRAVELCTSRLKEFPGVISGRIVLARALYHSGQYEAAEDQFYTILNYDPDHAMALKYLGDIKFMMGDESIAFNFYARVMVLEPWPGVLSYPVKRESGEATRILILKKKEEKITERGTHLRELPFRTETLADLLISQGHQRLAAQVLRELVEATGDVRLKEKLAKTEEALKDKEKKDVFQEN
nr:hypothetical protein [candidate division Zixibacteria bacterium]